MKHLKFWKGVMIVLSILILGVMGLFVANTVYADGYNEGVADSKQIAQLKINYAVENVMHEVDKAQQAAEIIEIKALLKEFGENKKLSPEKHQRLVELLKLEKYDKPIGKVKEREGVLLETTQKE